MRRAFSPKPFRIFRCSLWKLRKKSLQLSLPLPRPRPRQNHARRSHRELTEWPRSKPTRTEKRNLSRATVLDFFGLPKKNGEELRPRERKDRRTRAFLHSWALRY